MPRKLDKTSAALQQRTRDTYGKEALSEAQQRLCEHCTLWAGKCTESLLPITSSGEDCPYFTRKETA